MALLDYNELVLRGIVGARWEGTIQECRSQVVSSFPLESLLVLRANCRLGTLDADLPLLRLVQWLAPIAFKQVPEGFKVPAEFQNSQTLILLETHAKVPREATYLALLRMHKVKQWIPD